MHDRETRGIKLAEKSQQRWTQEGTYENHHGKSTILKETTEPKIMLQCQPMGGGL
jgi:hypothetical protein